MKILENKWREKKKIYIYMFIYINNNNNQRVLRIHQISNRLLLAQLRVFNCEIPH